MDLMKRSSYRRINITLPESTVAMLETIVDKGSRSTFIDEAIKDRAKRLKQQSVRELLKEGAIVHRERDLEIAREWFHLEEELWQD
jgi:CopG family transcriptional regulator / antitoxin EndoAI